MKYNLSTQKILGYVALILPAFVLAIVASPDTAHALTLLEPSVFPGGGTNPDPGEYIKNLYEIGVGLAGALAVVMVVVGGLEYIASAANPSARTDANRRIWAALGGLLLALFSFLLLRTINPNLVDFSVRLDKIEVPSSSGGGGATQGAGSGVALIIPKDMSARLTEALLEYEEAAAILKNLEEKIAGGETVSSKDLQNAKDVVARTSNDYVRLFTEAQKTLGSSDALKIVENARKETVNAENEYKQALDKLKQVEVLKEGLVASDVEVQKAQDAVDLAAKKLLEAQTQEQIKLAELAARPSASPDVKISDAQARAITEAEGIKWNATCVNGNQGTCGGSSGSVLAEMRRLNNEAKSGGCVGCVQINGVSETIGQDGKLVHTGDGPGTHHGGDKLDVALNPKLDSIIEKYKPLPVNSRGQKVYEAPNGSIYTKEVFPGNHNRDHWDILVPRGSIGTASSVLTGQTCIGNLCL